jgi:hypothetical protein
MEIGLSKEISKDVYSKADVLREISKALQNHFREKNYGNGLKNIAIGIICVGPEFDFFFKEQKKYMKNKKILEYDVKLDHKKFKESNEIEIRNMVKDNILSSLHILEDLKISDFDCEAFKADLKTFFQNM